MYFPIKNTIKSYYNFIYWLVIDSIWRNKIESFFILITGFFGVFFQVQVFGLIIYYAKHFSSGQAITRWGYTLDFRNSYWLLTLVSLSVVISLALAGLCIYFSRKKILSLGRKYGEFCSKRILNTLNSVSYLPNYTINDAGQSKYLFKLLTTDSRFCNRVLRMLLNMIIPALTLIVAMIALIYLEPFLTLMVLILQSFYIINQYKVSRKGANYSVDFETHSPYATLELRSMLDYFKHQPQNHSEIDMIDRLFSKGPIKKQMDAYEGRIRMVENSRLVSMFFMALTLGIIMVIMGSNIIHEGYGWERLLIYVIALRYAMANLQTSFALITSINRFYPQVRRYYHFIQNTCSLNKTADLPLPDYYVLTVGKKRLKKSEKNIVIGPGDRVAIVIQIDINRYTLTSFAKVMFSKTEYDLKSIIQSMRIVSAKHSCPQTELYKDMKIDLQSNFENIKYLFPNEASFEKAIKFFPKPPDIVFNKNIWDSMKPEIKLIFSFISAVKSDCRWILIDAISLNYFDQKSIYFYLELLKEKITLLIFNKDLSNIGTYAENSVVIVGEKTVIGLGSPLWYSYVHKEVKDVLLSKSKKKNIIDDDDEDFDDEG
jgi:hypothetical protein